MQIPRNLEPLSNEELEIVCWHSGEESVEMREGVCGR